MKINLLSFWPSERGKNITKFDVFTFLFNFKMAKQPKRIQKQILLELEDVKLQKKTKNIRKYKNII